MGTPFRSQLMAGMARMFSVITVHVKVALVSCDSFSLLVAISTTSIWEAAGERIEKIHGYSIVDVTESCGEGIILLVV